MLHVQVQVFSIFAANGPYSNLINIVAMEI